MNWLDIVVLVALGLLAVTGWRSGGVQIGVTAAGILAGIALASRQHGTLEPLFSKFIHSDNGAEIGAFVAIFILVLIASLVVTSVVRSVLGKLKLGVADKLVGLALGVVVTFAIGSAVLSTIQSYPVLGLEDTIAGSALGTFLADNVDVVLRGMKFLPSDLGV